MSNRSSTSGARGTSSRVLRSTTCSSSSTPRVSSVPALSPPSATRKDSVMSMPACVRTPETPSLVSVCVGQISYPLPREVMSRPLFPRSWSCGWRKLLRNGHKGNHNSKIGGLGQVAVDLLDHYRPLADRGRPPLHRTGPHVPGREDPRHAGLQR